MLKSLVKRKNIYILSEKIVKGYKRDLEQHQLEMEDDIYKRMNQQMFKQIKEDKSILEGSANFKGTYEFMQQREEIIKVKESNYRKTCDNKYMISSIGIGSYKGQINEQTDLQLFNAIQESINSRGVNYIDTGINWRYMQSERVVGNALKFVGKEYGIGREQIIVGAKCGFIPEDYQNDILNQMFVQEFMQKGLIELDEIVNGHSLNPHFIQKSIDTSRVNLQLSTIDIMYLTNIENHYALSKDVLFHKLATIFELFENNILKKKINNYGISTWNCFRVDPNNQYHIQLHDIINIAQKVAGNQHNFKYIQTPLNIMMPEVFIENYQGNQEERKTTLQMAKENGLNVITTSPLLSGTLINVPLDIQKVPLNYLSARHLQFIRSIPNVLCTVVGMKTSHHVKKNLEVVLHDPLTYQEFYAVLVPPTKRVQQPEQPVDFDDQIS